MGLSGGLSFLASNFSNLNNTVYFLRNVNRKIGDRKFPKMAIKSEIRAVPLRHAKRVCDQRTYLNLELNLELDLHLNLT